MEIKHTLSEQSIEGIKREMEVTWINGSGNTTHHNFWNAAKTVLRKKFIVINTYIKKKTQINNLTLYLK